MDNTDVNKVVVSNKNDFKYLAIKMLKIINLPIIFSKMSAFRRDFHKTICMNFLIQDKKLLEKNIIWKKVCNIIKKEFAIKPVYNEQYLKYLKTKIKVYTDFCGNTILKKNSQCICLSVVLLNSVFTIGKNQYPQIFLQNVTKEKKFKNIFDNIEISSHSGYEKNSDSKENSDK